MNSTKLYRMYSDHRAALEDAGIDSTLDYVEWLEAKLLELLPPEQAATAPGEDQPPLFDDGEFPGYWDIPR